jgi:hypothetical protein
MTCPFPSVVTVVGAGTVRLLVAVTLSVACHVIVTGPLNQPALFAARSGVPVTTGGVVSKEGFTGSLGVPAPIPLIAVTVNE